MVNYRLIQKVTFFQDEPDERGKRLTRIIAHFHLLSLPDKKYLMCEGMIAVQAISALLSGHQSLRERYTRRDGKGGMDAYIFSDEDKVVVIDAYLRSSDRAAFRKIVRVLASLYRWEVEESSNLP